MTEEYTVYGPIYGGPMTNDISKDWYKSSFCTSSANCVETRMHTDGSVDIRNSRDPQGPVVSFTKDEWTAFLSGVRSGEFDLA